MKKILYVFPHPDDESFGPAAAITAQIKNGDEVSLLCLTKGGATKQRNKLGLTVEEMGEVRYKEMLCVKEKLGLKNMKVIDLPDGGLKEIDPRIIEKEIKSYIDEIKPDIVITYAVHGISGFHDHLVSHAVVKRAYLEMKDEGADYLKRLAFFTFSEPDYERVKHKTPFKLNTSTFDVIDCEVMVTPDDIKNMSDALDCYESYKQVIDDTGIKESFDDRISFEIFGEDHKPPLKSLSEKLPS